MNIGAGRQNPRYFRLLKFRLDIPSILYYNKRQKNASAKGTAEQCLL